MTPYSIIAGNYAGGIDLTSGIENLAPNQLSVAENVRYSREGGVYTRRGFEQKADVATSAKVDSIGANEQALFVKSGTKILYSTDGTSFTDTGATRTAAARDFFLPHGDEMYATNATDGLIHIASDYTDTPVGSTDGTCLSELDGSMLMADGDIIRYSAPETEANPEYFRDFTANGAGAKKMSSTVRAMMNAAGIVLIGMADGIDYAYAFDVDTGALLTRTLTRSHGVPNAWSICYIENNTFAVFTGRRVLLVIGDAQGVRVIDDPFKPKNAFDYPVRALLQAADDDQALSWTHFDPTTRELLVSVITDGISQILVCNLDLGAWSVDTSKNFSGCANFKYRRYAADDSDDKVHLDDEGSTDNTLTIPHRFATGVHVRDDKRVTSDYTKVTFGGLLSGAGSFDFRLYVNGQLALEQPITAEGLQELGLMDTEAGVPLGAGNVGAETIGSGGSASEGFRFTYPLEIFNVGESIQLEWEANDEGTALEIRDSKIDAETDNELELDSL